MSSDKTAIDKLRGLLDERGVHHVGNGGMVRFIGKDGCVCRAYTRQNPLSVDVVMTDASPEQAINAMLGNHENDDKRVSDLEDELARRDAVIEALKSKNERLKSMVQLFGTY
jgi:hypothetical protein